MALSCSHQAAHLVEEDDRFVIYAPAIMNAEVVAYQGDIQQIKTLGDSNACIYRTLQKKLINRLKRWRKLSPICCHIPCRLERLTQR